MSFVLTSIFYLYSLTNHYDPELDIYKHTDSDGNVNFDQSTGCPTVPGVKSERKCCGPSYKRFPFRTLEGERAC